MSKASALASLISSSGGTIASIANIGDVQIASPADKQMLVRDGATGKWKNLDLDAAVPSSSVPLFNVRKKLRALPDVFDYGVSSTGADSADALEAAFAAVRADGHTQLFLPAGQYRLNRQIQMNHGVRLIGEHKSQSVINFYHNGTGVLATGSVENGGGLENLTIANNSGGASTAYVQLVASSTASPDFFIIEGCNFTAFGASMNQYGIIVNGTGRDGTAPGSGGLKGVRNIVIAKTQIFACNFASLDLRVARDLNMFAVSNFATGSGGVAKTLISAIASSNGGYNIKAVACSLGDVNMDIVDKVQLFGDFANIVAGASATNCRLYGTASTIGGFGINGNVAYV